MRDDLDVLIDRYLSNETDFELLNLLGESFLDSGRRSVAFMCFVESLRRNPAQMGILKIAESIEKYARPRFPEQFENNTVAVSVIMPTYNRHDEIRKSIESVLFQTFQDFELIVVNDGGPASLKDVISSFDSPKIRYRRLDSNKGLSAALNEGIVCAQGKYIAYLDDDDVYYPQHLEVLVKHIESSKGYDCVYSNSWRCYGEFKNDEFIETSRKAYDIRPKGFDVRRIFRDNYISTLNMLHKKECFIKAGLFNEELPCLMDWDLWLRFASYFRFCQVNEMTGEYRWKENNMSLTQSMNMKLFISLLRSYYEFDCGRVGLAKSYAENGRDEQTKSIFKELIQNYAAKIKTPEYVREMFLLNKRVGCGMEDAGLFLIKCDCLRCCPSVWTKEVFREGDIFMFLRLLPDVFVVFLKKLFEKIAGLFHR